MNDLNSLNYSELLHLEIENQLNQITMMELNVEAFVDYILKFAIFWQMIKNVVSWDLSGLCLLPI